MGGLPAGLDVRIGTPEGDPGEVLARIAAQENALLVVGTQQGHSLKRALHGSVSSYCARECHGPVAVVADGPAGPWPVLYRPDLHSAAQSWAIPQGRTSPRDGAPGS